jgi:hypothetical protein
MFVRIRQFPLFHVTIIDMPKAQSDDYEGREPLYSSGWNAGKFNAAADNPKIVRLAMLLPFVGNGR